MLRAFNIHWDCDPANINGLPDEVDIPVEIEEEYLEYRDDDVISDWLSDEYGYCHFGFELVEEDIFVF